jgi:hypothetical protein
MLWSFAKCQMMPFTYALGLRVFQWRLQSVGLRALHPIRIVDSGDRRMLRTPAGIEEHQHWTDVMSLGDCQLCPGARKGHAGRLENEQNEDVKAVKRKWGYQAIGQPADINGVV